MLFAVADPERGGPGIGTPFFWTINALEWDHVVETPPPLSWVGNTHPFF